MYCYLPNTTVLSANDTLAIENAASKLRSVGAKALWRFAYDRTAGEKMYTADMIVGHMNQLHEVFNANIDVIYVLQAGWLTADPADGPSRCRDCLAGRCWFIMPTF